MAYGTDSPQMGMESPCPGERRREVSLVVQVQGHNLPLAFGMRKEVTTGDIPVISNEKASRDTTILRWW